MPTSSEGRNFETCQLANGGKNVERFHNGKGWFACLGNSGIGDDQGRSEGFLEKGMFSPDRMLPEVPTMIAPEDDDRVVAQFPLIEFVEDAADEGVGIGHAPCIVATDLQGEGGIRIRVAVPKVVFHELARLMPRGLADRL